VLPAIQEHADIFYPDGVERWSEDQLMNLAHRMGSTIMAYAFDLENDEDEKAAEDDEEDDEWMEDKDGKLMMGMVPMADILNADAEFNASYSVPMCITPIRKLMCVRRTSTTRKAV
jgi:N-lysine methyltransferase SETD6